MNPAEWLRRAARTSPQRGALFCGDELIASYGAFYHRAAALSAWLSGAGVTPGDRVAIFAKNCPEYLIALYGIWHAGAVAVPVNAKLHEREAAWIIAHSGAKLCFTSGELAAPLKAALESECAVVGIDALPEAGAAAEPYQTQADDVIWLFYTSGTTGRPKGVMLTSLNLAVMSLTYLSDVDDVSPDDAALYAAPASHGAGLYNMVHVMRRARHIFPPSGGFDPAEIFTLAQKMKNISMFAAPTMVRRLTDLARKTGGGEGIKTIIYGGGPMYVADIIEAVEVMGPRFVQIYGQGECPMAITSLSREEVADRRSPRWRERLGSTGKAQSVVRIRITRDDGSEAATGEIGEIEAQGPLVMAGYWRNEESTKETIRDGWLRTGDMGVLDEEGYLTLHDRSKDVIISGGTNIYPREVEEALLTHPGVHEVSVIGQPDGEWGEIIIAFVVRSAGDAADEAALDAHCLSSIARFKRPKRYIFLEELPKNNYGKVVKTVLRERLGAAPPQRASMPEG